MNKKELIEDMAQKSGLALKDTEKALDAFVETVSAELKKGQGVQIMGFGTFEVRQRAAREGRNPTTGRLLRIR